MKMNDPRPVDLAIAAEVSARFAAGQDLDAILARMRALGLHKIDSIKFVREYHHVTLGQTKTSST